MMYWQRNGAEFTQQFLGGEGGSVWLVAEKCTILGTTMIFMDIVFFAQVFVTRPLFRPEVWNPKSNERDDRKIQIPQKTNESLDES